MIPRLFESDAAVRHLGERLLTCKLPRPEWTHEAHLAACLWLLVERPDIDVERDLPGIIRRYNESVGGVNDDHSGYHDTITRCFIAGARAHLRECSAGEALVGIVNAMLISSRGARDWPLRFYSRALLFSVAARRSFIAPDIASIG